VFGRNEPVDLTTLSAELQRRKAFERVGGGGYLMTLSSVVPTARNAAQYAEIVRDKSLLRKLIEACDEIEDRAYRGEEEARRVLDEAEAQLFSVTEQRVTSELSRIGPIMREVHDRIEDLARNRKPTGLPTGLKALDNILGGLQESDLIILAARPSMGKTSLAMNIASNIAIRAQIEDTDSEEGTRRPVVAIFSLEMSKESLVESMLCAEARYNGDRIRKGTVAKHDWGPLGDAASRIYDADVYVDDTPGITPLEIRAKARRIKARYGLDAVFVDYLQRIAPARRFDSEHLAVGEAAREMKTLARELNVPVFVLSQLSRRVEQRTTNPEEMRPMLSDLLASGFIEAEADVIAFLYRPEYYRQLRNKEEGDDAPEDRELGEGVPEEAEVIVGKHRNGPTGVARVAFFRHWRRFDDWASGSGQQPPPG
ncbi:MAG: replicative DNA helicase, partial [Armatimonadia bacterium]|nr:replicative DNA helicase [Armatimonadia bacterium]